MEMSVLHIFNPEHDIALASNLSNFTAPHAGRQLRSDLGWLPALWAEEGDYVLVENVEYAERVWKKMRTKIVSRLKLDAFHQRRVQFVSDRQNLSRLDVGAIAPWGWDSALSAALQRRGVDVSLLPDELRLSAIRQLSHRHTSAQLLPQLRMTGTIGESFECYSAADVEPLLERYGQVVMKAPWSSSGRGLRFLSVTRTPLSMQAGWLNNLLQRQGSVMVEPFYNKVKDFGMEFEVTRDGDIRYLGLSLFHTMNGAYVGNILASECAKRQMINRYVSVDLLDSIQQTICQEASDVFRGKYSGPFGVDMMIVANGDGFLLHPCVEINLRRTMGHVALSLSPADDKFRSVMRIYYTNSYKLSIRKL